jgi:hypothetical protein
MRLLFTRLPGKMDHLAIRTEMADLAARWAAVPLHGTLALELP